VIVSPGGTPGVIVSPGGTPGVIVSPGGTTGVIVSPGGTPGAIVTKIRDAVSGCCAKFKPNLFRSFGRDAYLTDRQINSKLFWQHSPSGHGHGRPAKLPLKQTCTVLDSLCVLFHSVLKFATGRQRETTRHVRQHCAVTEAGSWPLTVTARRRLVPSAILETDQLLVTTLYRRSLLWPTVMGWVQISAGSVAEILTLLCSSKYLYTPVFLLTILLMHSAMLGQLSCFFHFLFFNFVVFVASTLLVEWQEGPA